MSTFKHRNGPWESTRSGLEQWTRGAEALANWSRMRTAAPFAAFEDPAALLAYLHRAAEPHVDRNRVLTELVRCVQADHPTQLASALLVQALWPGLSGVRRRWQTYYRGRDRELISDLVVTLLLRARRLPLEKVTSIAATLCWGSERELSDAYRQTRRMRTLTDAHELAAIEHGPDLVDVRRWLTEHAPADAELVLRVAALGEDLTTVGRELGLSPNNASQRLKRARDRLRRVLEADRSAASVERTEAA